jgi:tetratricopeptide (TPR) repeat protein
MSKKRKKKKRVVHQGRSAAPSRLTSAAQTLGKRGGVATIAGGVVLLAGLFLAAALVFSPKQDSASETPVAIPAPDTRHMEAPVRSRLEAARNHVERQPDSGPAWGGYGAICDAHSLYECAEACYSMAIELDGQDFRWFYLLAFVSELRGAPADLVAERYEQASRLEPRLPTTYYRLGEALTRAGRLDEASAAYRKAIGIDADLAAAHRGLGQVALAQGDAQAAVASLGQAVALGADRNAATLASLAQAQMRLGDIAVAEATAERAAGASAELPVPDPVRLRIQQMNVSSAQSAIRAARMIQAGRYEDALEQMRVVEQSRPDEPSTHYRIGLCLAHLGQVDEALGRLERAAQLAPDNEVVQRELERVRKLAGG